MKFWPPKAKPPSPLYFLLCLHFAPPTREPTMARPNPITGTLREAIGSRGAMRWGRRGHAHGMRGQSRQGWGKGGSFWLLLHIVPQDVSFYVFGRWCPRNVTVPVLLLVGIIRVHFLYLNPKICKYQIFSTDILYSSCRKRYAYQWF